MTTATVNIDDNANEYNTDKTRITTTAINPDNTTNDNIRNNNFQESKSLPGSPAVNKHRRRLLRRSEHCHSPEQLLSIKSTYNRYIYSNLVLRKAEHHG